MPLIFQTQLSRLAGNFTFTVPMDAVSGSHLCVTLMMTVAMDLMKLIVVRCFSD